ncbi:uncharacterized protein LOC128675847 [Plodia interpunctella]|uniref:uncharacterized protein LOC128675847 n=1 Tax=Plodia interpunctella TaxID=58824 RepID=UPI002368B06B|nr:uncharacterized protein LOC128675847 [Plodia interpunctella]
MSKVPKFDFRDVSLGLKILRDFLLGRKHTLHCRFQPIIAPRSIPTPDIPRGPVYKYSNQYYCNRNVYDSVKPPVVAPVAQGPPLNQDPFKKTQPGGIPPESVCFNFAPTPGDAWWWDGHCYYECVPEPQPYCPERPSPPKDCGGAPPDPCAPCPPCPPIPLTPDKVPHSK